MLLLVQLSNTLQQLEVSPAACRSLVSHDIHHTSNAGCLHMAIMAGKLRLFQSLLDEGFDPNEIHSGKTPMEMCIALCSSTDSVRLVKSLIKHGANVNLNRPLHAACKRGVPAVVETLIQNGASTEILDRSSGLTPLQYTLDLLTRSFTESHISNLVQVALILLEHCELNVANGVLGGSSPLELAVLTSQPSIIHAIIAKGRFQFTLQDINTALQRMDSCFIGSTDDRENIIRALSSINVESVPSLQELSKSVVRNTMARKLSGVRDLPCPSHMKKFLLKDQSRIDGFRNKANDYLRLF